MKQKMEKEATTGLEQGIEAAEQKKKRRSSEREKGHDDRSSRGEGNRKRKMGKKALAPSNLTQPIATVRNDDI